MSAKFDTVKLGEVMINFLPRPGDPRTTIVETKTAFVNSKTGRTHGWTTYNGPWAKDTLDKLQELRLLMERDVHLHHFDTDHDGGGVSSSAGLSEGLGEYLAGDPDVPAV